MDGSPPGSSVLGIFQPRTLEWVAISFSNAWKWKVKVKSLSRVQLLATPWTAAHQAPLSTGFSRQEYWSGVPLLSHWSLTISKKKKKEEENLKRKKKKKKTWKKYSRLDFTNGSPLYLLLQVCHYKASLDISWWGPESPAVFLRNAMHILDKMVLYCVGLSHLLGHFTSLTLPVTASDYSLPINLTAQNIPPKFPYIPKTGNKAFWENSLSFLL